MIIEYYVTDEMRDDDPCMRFRRREAMPINIYLGYLETDESPVNPIIKALKKYGYSPVADDYFNVDDIALKKRIQNLLAIIYVWSAATNERIFVPSKSVAESERLRYLSIRIDDEARIPSGFDTGPSFDLSHWTGDPEDSEFRRLRAYLDETWKGVFKTGRPLYVRQPLKIRK